MHSCSRCLHMFGPSSIDAPFLGQALGDVSFQERNPGKQQLVELNIN